MRQEQNNIFAKIDWLLVFVFILLVGFGWINIYAASRTTEDPEVLSFSTKHGKQFVFICLTIPLIILILFFNSTFYEKFSSLFYLIAIASLMGLFAFGKTINGATSWYNFGSIGLQPSEFVKAFTALAIAKLLSDRKYNLKLIKNQIKAFIIVFIPAILIILQPDAGSALVYLAFFLVLNREGLTLNYILFGALVILLFILIILFGHISVSLWIISIISIGLLYAIYRGGKRFIRFNWHKVIMIYLMTLLFTF